MWGWSAVPFGFEAATRKKNAEEGIAKLKDHVDTLITIPNDRLLTLIDGGESTYTWEDALQLADSVLQQGIQAIAEVITVPGEINVDFADVRTILSNAGPAWLAIGKGKGDSRAADAARMATKSPLLDITMDGAKRILFVITGGASLTLQEVQDAAQVIQDMSDPEANIIFGTCRDPRAGGRNQDYHGGRGLPGAGRDPGICGNRNWSACSPTLRPSPRTSWTFPASCGAIPANDPVAPSARSFQGRAETWPAAHSRQPVE